MKQINPFIQGYIKFYDNRFENYLHLSLDHYVLGVEYLRTIRLYRIAID